jgi:hypothetical protein
VGLRLHARHAHDVRPPNPPRLRLGHSSIGPWARRPTGSSRARCGAVPEGHSQFTTSVTCNARRSWRRFGEQRGQRAAAFRWRAAASGAARVISAFHSAQPDSRAQVPASCLTTSTNLARAAPSKSVQAITRSQAGSPTPDVPKSITADSVPATSTNRLPTAVRVRRGRRGYPRRNREHPAAVERVAPAAGPPAGSGLSMPQSAIRNRARSSAKATGSAMRSSAAGLPSINCRTDHGHG